MNTFDLKSVRKELGENQTQFGRRFGVDTATISRWESHGIPVTGTARMAIEQKMREIIGALEITRPRAPNGEKANCV